MKRSKTFASILLSFVLLLSFTSTAFAASPNDQIVTNGYTRYYNASGSEVTQNPVLGSNAVVSLAKTVTPSGTEGEFDVKLDVKTSVNISSVSQDAAVVLVLDVSSSMKSHLSSLKSAAKTFLNAYGEDANGGKRMMSLVAITMDSIIKESWLDVSNKTNFNTMQSAIDGLQATGYTNMEGGLQLARNLINGLPSAAGKTINNKNVILFSDGLPTCVSVNSIPTSGTVPLGSNVTGWTKGTKVLGLYAQPKSSPFSESVRVSRVEGMANQVKSLATLYGVAFSTSGGSGFSSWGPQWVTNTLATNASYGYWVQDTSQLSETFKNLKEQIIKWAEAWIVTDIMGDNITFNTTIPQNDITSGRLNFNSTTKALSWDVRKSAHDSFSQNIYSYSYTYKIKLDSNASNFVYGQPYPTNAVIPNLTYYMVENGVITSGVMTGYFSIPKVKALTSGFNFKKVGEDSVALSGCVFKLTDQSAASRTFNATSGSNGNVSFANIPSGRTYTLEEVSVPDSLKNKYKINTDKYTVTISFGTVTIKDSSGKIWNNGFNFINPILGKRIMGLVSPIAVTDNGLGSGFLSKHDTVVELRPTFNTPASPNLRTICEVSNAADKTGVFTFNNVPYGTYVLYIKQPGYLVRTMMVTVSSAYDSNKLLRPPDDIIFKIWGGDTEEQGYIDTLSLMKIYVLMDLEVDYKHASYDPACDLNADGQINNLDIQIVLDNWERSMSDYPGSEGVNFDK